MTIISFNIFYDKIITSNMNRYTLNKVEKINKNVRAYICIYFKLSNINKENIKRFF